MRGNFLGIFVTPTETSLEYVRTTRAVHMTPPMMKRIENVKEGRLLLRDPLNDFFSAISDEVISCTYSFLQEESGLDLSLLRTCASNPAPVKHLMQLKRMHAILDEYGDLPHALLKTIRDLSEKRVEKFLGQLEPAFLFPIDLLSSLDHLKSFNFSSYAKACLLQIR
jgi:hypothetical protein